MHRHYDWLVVGAGFTGAVFAERMASQADQRVLVIDRRTTLGGNAHDHRDETGVLRHVHGPHLFHTNSPSVFQYLSRFTEWMNYEHRMRVMIDGRLVPLPFNFASIDTCFPQATADRFKRTLLSAYGADAGVPILTLRERREPELRELAEFIYESVFRGYTRKQWGMLPEALSPAVTGRVPIRTGYDDRYFQDRFQCQPREGYTSLFERMLAHERIELRLGCGLDDLGSDVRYDRMLYTGPLDAFFGYEFGHLPYRSLAFEFRRHEGARVQPVATINYPGDEPFTRITDFGHLCTGERTATTLAVEYPQPYLPGTNEPYYPVPCDDAERLRQAYAARVAACGSRVLFAGRLADYRYINMDQAVARAMLVARRACDGAEA
jgi:UDP-galactopyranose mutase